MKIQTFFNDEEVKQIKTLSNKIFGKDNVSGYIRLIIKQALNDKPPPTKTTFKPLVSSMQTDNPPKWKTDAAQRIKRKPTPPAAKKTKHLTPKDLQRIADSTMK